MLVSPNIQVNVRMKSYALILVSGMSMAWSLMAASADLPNASDHPLVSRFQGSEIIGYNHEDFARMQLPTGAARNGAISNSRTVSGASTVLVYTAPKNKKPVEILENYRASLAQAGFHIEYTCDSGDGQSGCGGYSFATLYANPLLTHITGSRNDMLYALDAATDDVSYLLATLSKSGKNVSVGVMVSQDGNRDAGILVQIAEEGAMTTGQVTVDADAMSKGLATEGKIALYGLTFDTDSAKLTAASGPTLKQMSDLLHKQASLKVYIVGHTDDTGALAHNLTLSQQRAESVVKALTTTYGIAANRLSAKGLASYAPVASNHSDAGKAKNRRVELVEQ